MQILRHYDHVAPTLRGSVAALGNFDGVHLGHQQVLGEAARVAHELGVPLMALVFEPHPRQFFFPNEPFFRLTPFRSKAKLLARFEVDILAAIPFDAAMSQKLAPDFMLDVLINGLRISHAVAGYDFRFGNGRTGDATMLAYMGEMEGFGVSIVEEVRSKAEGGVPYSSTRIRDLLAQGRPREAAGLLGHWWTVEGHVLPGDRRGRTIGFPTANIALEDHVEPALGVYAVRVEVEDGPHQGVYDGVANVGRRPTFDKQDVLLEAHLFNFDGDIYGHHAAIFFIEFLRSEMKFSSLDALKTQIALDSAQARELLATMPAGDAALVPV